MKNLHSTMKKNTIKSVMSSYGKLRCPADILEYLISRGKEKIFGIDYSIFDKTISYYDEVKGEIISKEDALARALNKKEHKDAWHKRNRNTVQEKMHFYKEVDIYLFRQPYLKRHGGFRWYRQLIKHIHNPSVLEYGCGSAVLTEYLLDKYPDLSYTVADIPSNTLDFVRWKQKKYNYPYKTLTIGPGKSGIPLVSTYSLIICQDVLEHTPNPLEIVTAFVEHLAPGGVLVLDFLKGSGGENLVEAREQRESVKLYLKRNLIPLKAIDEPRGNNGLYAKRV